MAYSKSEVPVDKTEETHCPICLDVFHDAWTLSCSHSYCARCLGMFINKHGTPDGGVDCPSCRQHCDTKSKVERKQEGAMSKLFSEAVKSPVKEKELLQWKYCGNCLKHGREVDATCFCFDCNSSLCEGCRKIHLQFSEMSSTEHQLEDIDSNKIKHIKQIRELMFCGNHPGKRFEYVCKDHDVMCCHQCVIVAHRMCKDIKTVEEHTAAKKKFKLNRDKGIKKLLSLQTEANDLARVDALGCQSLADQCRQIEHEIGKFEDKAVEMAHRKARCLKEHTYKEQRKLSCDIMIHKIECDQVGQRLKEAHDLLRTVQRNESELQKMCATRHIMDEIKLVEGKLTELKGESPPSHMSRYAFDSAIKCFDEVHMMPFDEIDYMYDTQAYELFDHLSLYDDLELQVKKGKRYHKKR